MPTKINLNMPQPGETITSGTIVKWLIAPGNDVKEGQNIIELETEKAVFEYASPYEGKVLEILAKDGASVPVGDPIAVFEVEDAKAQAYSLLSSGKPKSEAASSPAKSARPNRPASNATSSGAAKLSPLIRSLMHEHNLSAEDIGSIQGSGPGGRVTKEDVLDYLGGGKKTAAPAAPKAPVRDRTDVEVVPCTPVRLRIAENMVASKRAIPHAHFTLSVDVTKIVEYRAKNKDQFKAKNGLPLAFLPLLFPGIKKAIQAHPLVNSSFWEEEKAIAFHKKINLGVAIGTEKGLFNPVIHNVEKMGYVQLAKELEGLIGRANSGKLTVKDLTGLTFTFNNYGYYGTTIGAQIILPPQSTTLGMGAFIKRPWVVGDEVKVRVVSEVTLAFDHRILDGRDAGLFLKDLKAAFENFSESDLE